MDDGPAIRDVGAHIRERRRQMKMTQAELAKAAGMSRATVQAYENGRNKIGPSYVAVKRIAKALKCTLDDLNNGEV